MNRLLTLEWHTWIKKKRLADIHHKVHMYKLACAYIEDSSQLRIRKIWSSLSFQREEMMDTLLPTERPPKALIRERGSAEWSESRWEHMPTCSFCWTWMNLLAYVCFHLQEVVDLPTQIWKPPWELYIRGSVKNNWELIHIFYVG